mmetsp:Transcript_19289/g.52991  ORF Transcript_19289/g.52991 Transcript_19289/m.52991 type:complete len:221 (-) Transcript_19289:239-901(-)
MKVGVVVVAIIIINITIRTFTTGFVGSTTFLLRNNSNNQIRTVRRNSNPQRRLAARPIAPIGRDSKQQQQRRQPPLRRQPQLCWMRIINSSCRSFRRLLRQISNISNNDESFTILITLPTAQMAAEEAPRRVTEIRNHFDDDSNHRGGKQRRRPSARHILPSSTTTTTTTDGPAAAAVQLQQRRRIRLWKQYCATESVYFGPRSSGRKEEGRVWNLLLDL